MQFVVVALIAMRFDSVLQTRHDVNYDVVSQTVQTHSAHCELHVRWVLSVITWPVGIAMRVAGRLLELHLVGQRTTWMGWCLVRLGFVSAMETHRCYKNECTLYLVH